MKLRSFIVLILACVVFSSSPALSQVRGGYSHPEDMNRNSFFVALGYTSGPYFDEFVDWADNYYYLQRNTPDSIENFSGSFDISIGMRIRFSRHLATEFDFLTYTLKTRQEFTSPDIINYPNPVSHILELNVAVISGSLLILFDFGNNQRIVPYFASGLSIFPMRLDHSRQRHIKTALAFNFAAGLDIKISPEIWLNLRGDRTLGKANMPVSQGEVGQPDSFELNLSTTQIQAGVMYSFQ